MAVNTVQGGDHVNHFIAVIVRAVEAEFTAATTTTGHRCSWNTVVVVVVVDRVVCHERDCILKIAIPVINVGREPQKFFCHGNAAVVIRGVGQMPVTPASCNNRQENSRTIIVNVDTSSSSSSSSSRHPMRTIIVILLALIVQLKAIGTVGQGTRVYKTHHRH
jgi:hypothetical protein